MDKKKEIVNRTSTSPPEIAKIQLMLRQVEVWIKAGETELAEKHWELISEEARKYGR
jgi:hypothetical protein